MKQLVIFLAVLCVTLVSASDDEIHSTQNATDVQQEPWQKLAKSLVGRLHHLLENGEYSDVNVAVGNESFHLHRLILSMTSHVWARILHPENEAIPNDVVFDGVQPSTFRQLLQYAYEGTVDLSSMSATWDLWKAATHFQIDDLVQKTAQHINTAITVNNVLEAFEKAAENNETNLEQLCLEMIEHKASDVLIQPYFLQLREENLKRIVERPLLDATEAQIFTGVVEWAKTSMWKNNVTSSPATLQHELHSILPLLNFDVMTPDEYVLHVEPTGILSPELSNLRLRAMLHKLMPTGQVSKTRRKLREVTCTRWNNAYPDSDSNYIDYTRSAQDHVLKFKVNCGAPTCNLIGMHVTESYSDARCDFLPLPIKVTLSEVTTGRELATFTEKLSYPYRIDFPRPVSMETNDVYRVYMNIAAFRYDECCGNNCRARRAFLNSTEYAYWRGLKMCTNCNVKPQCGTMSVQFMDDHNSEYTNTQRGLLESLIFV